MQLMKINMNQHLPRGICILHQTGVAAIGKISPCRCNGHCLISFDFFVAICFSSIAPRALEIFHLVLKISTTNRDNRAVQMFMLEFSKDGLSDRGGEIYRWWLGQTASDTLKNHHLLICRQGLLLPCVSVL